MRKAKNDRQWKSQIVETVSREREKFYRLLNCNLHFVPKFFFIFTLSNMNPSNLFHSDANLHSKRWLWIYTFLMVNNFCILFIFRSMSAIEGKERRKRRKEETQKQEKKHIWKSDEIIFLNRLNTVHSLNNWVINICETVNFIWISTFQPEKLIYTDLKVMLIKNFHWLWLDRNSGFIFNSEIIRL